MTPSLENRLTKMRAQIAEALADHDAEDLVRIKDAENVLFILDSEERPGDDQAAREAGLRAALTDYEQRWAMWATTGHWPRFHVELQSQVDRLFEALDAIAEEEPDEDDDAKIAADRSALVYAVSTEDVDRVIMELKRIEAARATWSTSGMWPITIKPSKPPRPDVPAPSDNLYEKAKSDRRQARVMWGGALGTLGWLLWRR